MSLAQAAIILFFIMDPLGNVPVFHSILEGNSPGQRIKIILRECTIAYIILLAFLGLGKYIQAYLGFSVSSLYIAGGIMLLLIAIGMVFPGSGIIIDDEDKQPFIVPLATPLIAGPSAIAFVLVLTNSHPERLALWLIAITIAWLLAACILLLSPWLLGWLGSKGSRALEKLMGMMLIVLAVQMLLNGVTFYIKSMSS